MIFRISIDFKVQNVRFRGLFTFFFLLKWSLFREHVSNCFDQFFQLNLPASTFRMEFFWGALNQPEMIQDGYPSILKDS